MSERGRRLGRAPVGTANDSHDGWPDLPVAVCRLQRARRSVSALAVLNQPDQRLIHWAVPGAVTWIDRRGGRLLGVLKVFVGASIVGIVLLAWLLLRGYGDGGPQI